MPVLWNLKVLRATRELSQLEVSQRARLRQGRISELERGVRATSGEVRRLARVLDVPLAALTASSSFFDASPFAYRLAASIPSRGL